MFNSKSIQARRSVFQIGGAPIRAEAESVKNLGVRSPRIMFRAAAFIFLEIPYCEFQGVILCSEVLRAK